jgi:hypothetical protein
VESLLFLQLLFQVFCTCLSRSLVPVQGVLFVDGIGKDDCAGSLVNPLNACRVIGMNLTKDKHLHRSWLFSLGRPRNYIGRPRLVAHYSQRNFLFLECSRQVVSNPFIGVMKTELGRTSVAEGAAECAGVGANCVCAGTAAATFQLTKTLFEGFSPGTTCRDRTPMAPLG